MLNKSFRRKLYEYIVEEIGLRILKGQYAPGETLPNEDALCKEFDVSRGVLREAHKVLAHKGLIQIRPKIGTQVQPRKTWNLFDTDVLYWKLKIGSKFEFFKNVTEVRRVIESEGARLAALRASLAEIEKIQLCYDDMAEALADENSYDYETYLTLDMGFHSSILEASHNDLLAQIGHTMRQAVQTARKIDTQDIEIQRAALPFHFEMLSSITQKNAQAAYLASQKMFDHICKHIPDMAAITARSP
jgi:DNA-binding FadR family transcriptional regulator